MNMPTFTRDYLQLLPLATGESDPENVSSFTTLRFPRQCITFNSFFLSLSPVRPVNHSKLADDVRVRLRPRRL